MGASNNNFGNKPTEGWLTEYLETKGFIAREKPDYTNFDKKINGALYDLMIKRDANSVEILRPLWFFAEEQKGITLGKLREFYTEKAIALFEEFGYIKVGENEKLQTQENQSEGQKKTH